MTRRELWLSLCAALWGVAIAVSLAPVWTRPAPPGQMPGYATAHDLDAHGPMRFVIGLIVIPIVIPFVLRPVLRRLDGWAANVAAIAMLVALWYVGIARDSLGAIVPTAIVLALCAVVGDPRFTRRDVVLLPAFGATWLGVMDVAPMLTVERAVLVAALLVFVVRVLVAKAHVEPALTFVLSPIALALQTSFFARDQRYFGWHALAIALLSPFVLRFVLRDARRARAALALVIYPLAAYSYANATSLTTAEGKPRVTFFEDAHRLMPASELLRGELPFRDVLMAHGMMEDGLFDYAAMKVRGVNIGEAHRARILVGGLNVVALYALGFAVTGSAEAGFLTFVLATLFGATGPGTIRVTPALFTLALIASALRRRNPRPLFWAGIGVVVCVVTSLDFAAFTLVTLFVAAIRMRAVRPALTGLLAATVPLFVILALFGIADDFVRATLFEVLTLGPAYALDLFTAPQGFKIFSGVPEIVASLFHKTSYLYIAWLMAVVFLGVTFLRKPQRRLEPLVAVALWIALCAVSYAERHHLHWQFAVPAFAIGLAFLVRRRALVPVLLLLLMIAWPTTHVAVTGWMRQSRVPIEEGWRELAELPRARGAFFTERDAGVVLAAQKYASLSLAPDETYFDFSNRALLFFLLRRDCPVRQYEVAFYQSEERQREVIAALERNPKVRAVLMPGPQGEMAVDGVLSQTRAPLVWQWIEQNFHPDFAEGEVVFWRRK